MNTMKFWKKQKSGENENTDERANMHARTESNDYKLLWLLVCVTYNQILPGNDLYLCVNEYGEVALMMLPDLIVSQTLGTVFYEKPHPSVVLVQHFRYGKDESYLVPALLTDKLSSAMTDITIAFNSGKLEKNLKNYSWQKIMSEVNAHNSNFLDGVKYQRRINRSNIIDRTDATKADNYQQISGYQREIPVFIYFGPDEQRKLTQRELERELVARQLLCQENIDYVRDSIKTSTAWFHLDENDTFIHVINRTEVEIKLKMNSWPSFTDLLLDPEMAEYSPGPPPGMKFTPKGVDLFEKTKPRELLFGLLNWGEPDIAQVSLHVRIKKEQSPKNSVTAPSATIFKDEMGIHVLQSKLFRVDTSIFTLERGSDSPVLLDALSTSQIPEICWESIYEEASSDWWQTDALAKKVLWLVSYNLASHTLEDPEEVIYAVTPIGNDVVQIMLLFDSLEEGSPYAFAVVRDEFTIKAIPVFPSGTYEMQSDGALVSNTITRIKNYCITRDGERIDLQSAGQMMQFIKPIYSVVISGKHKTPEIYEAR
jgi:hypothetical protein